MYANMMQTNASVKAVNMQLRFLRTIITLNKDAYAPWAFKEVMKMRGLLSERSLEEVADASGKGKQGHLTALREARELFKNQN